MNSMDMKKKNLGLIESVCNYLISHFYFVAAFLGKKSLGVINRASKMEKVAFNAYVFHLCIDQ
jgi:hypothetical protein